jgi:predicted DNA-binding protein
MKKNEVFATKIPGELKRQISLVCENLGLKKNFVVEEAIREKLEDLMDAHDLHQAVKEATGFHSWSAVKKDLK